MADHPWYRATNAEPLPGAGASGPVYPPSTPAERFLGGPPVAVVVRLLVVSLIVGAALMWLDIRPVEVFTALRRFVHRLWYFGWDSIRSVVDYVLAGALLVVPCWLILRLMNYRGRAP